MNLNAARDPAALERRRFIADSARAACGAGIVGLLLALHARKAAALPATALRPPGALAEPDFLAACVRCGLCVRDCPYKILDLAHIESAVATGTPSFTARTGPCEMCEDVPCVKACPTGALDPKLTDIDQARMGLAVLVDHEACLNFQGLRCDVCYRVCPRLDKAITLEPQHNQRTAKHTLFIPTVHSEHCTGCGKCEQGCVLETAAIRVFPLHLAKGAGGSHYRMGWEEKAKAGKSLIDERGMIEMPKRLPEVPAAAEMPPPGRPKAAAPPWGAGAEGSSGAEVTR